MKIVLYTAYTAFWLIAVVGLNACDVAKGPPIDDPGPLQAQARVTAHTARLPGANPEQITISLTNAVYGATREENSAGSVILSPQNAALAFTAMHRITHMPVNAPLFYLTETGELSEATFQEMKRVNPDGNTMDAQIQLYTVGKIDKAIIDRLAKTFKLREFREDDPVKLAELLDRWQAAMKSNHPDEVVIANLDHPQGIAYGLGAMGWNAHMGKGFAWVTGENIPVETKNILTRRFGQSYIYLAGGADVISHDVAEKLSQYGLVRRIGGADIYAASAVNAGYKDFGRNWGWGWNWTPRTFGWGIAQAGHNFIIVNGDDMLAAIPAVLLGHMGKHGPVLVVTQDSVPQSVADYLTMVKPFKAGPTKTILNHAWIIGSTGYLSDSVQNQIDSLLRPAGLDPAAFLQNFDEGEEQNDQNLP